MPLFMPPAAAVPLAPAELLVSVLLLSARLQPVPPIAINAIDETTSICFKAGFMSPSSVASPGAHRPASGVPICRGPACARCS
ncbi:protein of unknown function [Paraburkholderia kururiensis]